MIRGGSSAASPPAPCLAELWLARTSSRAYRELALSTRKSDGYRWTAHIAQRLGAMDAGKIDGDELREFQAAIRDASGPGSAIKCVSQVRATLAWATDAGLLRQHPCKGVRLLRSPPAARRVALETAEQVERLAEGLRDLRRRGQISLSQHAQLLLLVATGARKGEADGLRWASVEVVNRRAFVTSGKNAQRPERPIYFEGELGVMAWNVLMELRIAQLKNPRRRASRNPAHGYVFVGYVFERRAGARGPQLVRPMALLREEGWVPEGLTIHGLRHTFCSRAAAMGATPEQIAWAAGHSSAATTRGYVHGMEGERRTFGKACAL